VKQAERFVKLGEVIDKKDSHVSSHP